MDKVFFHQIGRFMEVYVDDMVVRSLSMEDHVKDRADVFDKMRKYGTWLNPAKCTFGVPVGKFMGFIRSSQKS